MIVSVDKDIVPSSARTFSQAVVLPAEKTNAQTGTFACPNSKG